MPTYAPGSFTKNFGWSQGPGKGLSRLYEVIRSGFSNKADSVRRDDFRSRCGITDTNRQLIPVNFFLHNTIKQKENYVSVDELVRHAINNPYSHRFDYLALFSLHLSRMGRRVAVAGDRKGAAFTNNFVRNRLWVSGGWEASKLNDVEVEASFQGTIAADGDDTVHKCVTNYLYILEIAGLRHQRTPTINTRADEWVGPGLFLAFDRFWMDQSAPPSRVGLLAMVKEDQLHKLMGVTEPYLDAVSPLLVDEYLALGGPLRASGAAIVGHSGIAVISSPVAVPSAGGPTPPSPVWSDQAAEDVATIMRRLQEIQAQIRNMRHVRELKSLYAHTCIFCLKQVIVGVDPTTHYSEAAHIKPVGLPHNGPDVKSNMIILCPEHHLQFDRGILRIRKKTSGFYITSKISGDDLNNRLIILRSPHVIGDEYVRWHDNFWKP
jgi:hypothetical protein